MTETIERNATAANVAQQPRLLDRMRVAIRTKHYSLSTERSYCDWAKRFILFHGKRHPAEMGATDHNQPIDIVSRRPRAMGL